MREIKFRAWDEENKEMFVPDGNGYFSSANHLFFVIDGNGEPIYLDDLNTPEDIVFMQYTGLKDKNGKEIYEGDIVDVVMHEDVCNPSTKYLIEYHNTGFYLKYKNIEGDIEFIDICGSDCCIKSIEIIGNDPLMEGLFKALHTLYGDNELEGAKND